MNALATSSKPDILSIREGWSLWLLNGLLFLIPLAILTEIIAPTLPSRAILFSVGGIVVGRLRRAAAFALIGDTGVLWWSLRRLGRAGLQSVEWKDIEGCARKNEDRLHILRIFPRPIPNNWPLLQPGASPSFAQRVDEWFRPWPRGLRRIDIDFNFAEEPGAAVERAFEASATWIAISRDRDTNVPVVRDFGELTASELRKLARGRRFFGIYSLDIPCVFFTRRDQHLVRKLSKMFRRLSLEKEGFRDARRRSGMRARIPRVASQNSFSKPASRNAQATPSFEDHRAANQRNRSKPDDQGPPPYRLPTPR